MSTAADKKRWDDLHAAQAEAIAAKDEFEQGIWRVYGGSYQPSWLKKGERTKLEALNTRVDKIGDKIIDLLVRVSPRGEAWLSGVPAHWIRRDLTWEDAIRPEGEPLSVDVPQAWGSNRKFTEESVMSRRVNESGGRRNLESTDAAHFREFLEKNVILVGGDAEGSIDVDDPDPVYVVIVVDVTSYGPHQGAIYAKQNRFHPGHHGPLEAAHEILEDWVREHYGNGTEDDEALTETFDAVGWKLKPKEFADAIAGTKAAEYIETHSSREDEPLEEHRTMNAKPKNHRKAVADTIEDLKSQLLNYHHGPGTFPDLIFRILASAQGGEDFEDVGYEPFQGMGWHEWTLLTEVLEVIENREDVEAFAQGLLHDDEEQLEERRRPSRRR